MDAGPARGGSPCLGGGSVSVAMGPAPLTVADCAVLAWRYGRLAVEFRRALDPRWKEAARYARRYAGQVAVVLVRSMGLARMVRAAPSAGVVAGLGISVPFVHEGTPDCPDCGGMPALLMWGDIEERWVWLCECGSAVVSEHGASGWRAWVLAQHGPDVVAWVEGKTSSPWGTSR